MPSIDEVMKAYRQDSVQSGPIQVAISEITTVDVPTFARIEASVIGRTIDRDLFPDNSARGSHVALVIGIDNYAGDNKLVNPKNDAKRVADSLRARGYNLLDNGAILDADYEALNSAIRRFSNMARGKRNALVYYAGHGIQSASLDGTAGGENFLIPRDAKFNDHEALRMTAIPLQFLIDAISTARRKLIVLDACRNYIFSGARGLVQTTGLSYVHPNRGLIVAYSTTAGKAASDGRGKAHSPYADAFIRQLESPQTRSIRQMLINIYDEFDARYGNSPDPYEWHQLPVYSDMGGRIHEKAWNQLSPRNQKR